MFQAVPRNYKIALLVVLVLVVVRVGITQFETAEVVRNFHKIYHPMVNASTSDLQVQVQVPKVPKEAPDPSLVPAMIIAGTQKGGTDALTLFLDNHPQLKKGFRREAHFFDFFCGELCERAVRTKSKELIEQARAKYSFELQHDARGKDMKEKKRDSEFMFEKTPIYLFNPYVAEKTKIIVPWTKIIILLRDPVERAYSTFKMNYDRRFDKRFGKIKEEYNEKLDGKITFERCIDIDIEKLTKAGIVGNDTFWMVDDKEREQRWLSYWDIHDEDKLTELMLCDNEIGRGLYFLQLLQWFKEYNTVEDREKIYVTKSESILPDKETHVVDLKPITDFLGIDELEVISEEKIHATVSHFGPMKDETEQKLMEIFDPFNKKLESLLGKDWKDPWPYK
mmetsp:Transcript_25980/g.38911  ORF Transcript_25980/g.38911 Transcript_25980/m.38911 type:complete len:394 (-) Transcript_25980:184-1365(-)